MAIKTIIRLQNNMVMVFDDKGEQVPEYQGQYEEVKQSILNAASAGAVFQHWYDGMPEAEPVFRQNW